jgi:hypothetical protein
MVIFNLWAIPVGIVVILAIMGLGRLWPAATQPPLEGWATGAVLVVIGGLADLVGLKARVFFLPIWLIGLGVLGYQMGWPGTLGFVALLGVAAVWIQRKTKREEQARWQQLQFAAKTNPPAIGSDEPAFWTWVKESLFLPVCADYTPDVCAHDLRILKLLRESGIPLSAEENLIIGAQEGFLEKARTAEKPPVPEAGIRRAMEDLMEKRARAAQESRDSTRPGQVPVG